MVIKISYRNSEDERVYIWTRRRKRRARRVQSLYELVQGMLRGLQSVVQERQEGQIGERREGGPDVCGPIL